MNIDNIWFTITPSTHRKYYPTKLLQIDDYFLVITNDVIFKLDISSNQILDLNWFSQSKLPEEFNNTTIDMQAAIFENGTIYVLDRKKIIPLDISGNIINNMIYSYKTIEVIDFTMDNSNLYLLDVTNRVNVISRSELNDDPELIIDNSYNVLSPLLNNNNYYSTSIENDNNFVYVSIKDTLTTTKLVKDELNLNANSFYSNSLNNYKISESIIKDDNYSSYRKSTISRINKLTSEIDYNWCTELLSPYKIKIENSTMYLVDYFGGILIVDINNGEIKQKNIINNRGLNDIVIRGTDVYLSTWPICSIILLKNFLHS
jgi:hypothetical protein